MTVNADIIFEFIFIDNQCKDHGDMDRLKCREVKQNLENADVIGTQGRVLGDHSPIWCLSLVFMGEFQK